MCYGIRAAAPASESITASGAGAITAGAPASAILTASGANARTAGAPASASITATGVNARTAGAPASWLRAKLPEVMMMSFGDMRYKTSLHGSRCMFW